MQAKLEYRSFLLLLLLVSLTFFTILAPFFGVIFWAIAISIVFAPLYTSLMEKIKRPNICALLTLSICALIVVIPFLMIANSFLNQGLAVYHGLESGSINLNTYAQQIKEAFPIIQEFLDKLGITQADLNRKAGEIAIIISKFIAQNTVVIGQGTLTFLAQVGILLYLTFYIMRDSDTLITYLHKALPLGDAREALFFNKFSEVTRATIKGSLVVAIVQGSLGGFIFWVLGINAPLLWGVVMTLLSLVPLIGAGLVWLPVALYLFAIGDTQSAIILIAFGVIVIGLVDNILRPLLVGRDTKLPDYLVLLSTLGGFSVFGMNGFVIGPLVAALFVTSWNIFTKEFNMEKIETEEENNEITVNVNIENYKNTEK